MKRLLKWFGVFVLLYVCLLGVVMSCGCRSETEYGQCVGLDDDQNPGLRYKLSTRNVILGVIFVETIIVPIYVALENVYCPVGPVPGK